MLFRSNSLGVARVVPVAAEVLDAQLAALAADLRPAVIKTGLIGSAEGVAVLMRWLDRLDQDGGPRVRLVDGERVTDWPKNAFAVASPPGSDRDFVLFSGIEPHLRWHSFLAAFEEVLRGVGCTTSVTLAAQPAAVPHTRPLPVTLSASDTDFEAMFALQAPTSRYQGPTGIVGVLNLHLRALGWRNASLWALTPHYLTVGPNPNVGLSLLRRVDHGFGTATSLRGLEDQLAAFDEQVREALEESDEAGTYVRQLESQYDAEHAGSELPPAAADAEPDDLPSPDELLSDLERFLRDQQRGGSDT